MTDCIFSKVADGPNGKAVWRCTACGFRTIPLRYMPHRSGCDPDSIPPGAADADGLSWLNCPYRGKVLNTVSGQEAGCGCASSSVQVFKCHYFSCPVLKKAAARCLEKVRRKVPDYDGRTCRGCLPLPIELAISVDGVGGPLGDLFDGTYFVDWFGNFSWLWDDPRGDCGAGYCLSLTVTPGPVLEVTVCDDVSADVRFAADVRDCLTDWQRLEGHELRVVSQVGRLADWTRAICKVVEVRYA